MDYNNRIPQRALDHRMLLDAMKFRGQIFIEFAMNIPANNQKIILISPATVLLLPLLPVIFSGFVDASTYENYIAEKFIFSVFSEAGFFYCASLASIYSGYFFYRLICPGWPSYYVFGVNKLIHPHIKVYAACFVIFCCILLATISLLLILRNTPGLIAFIFSGGGGHVKSIINAEGAFAAAQPLLIAVNGYCHFLYLRTKNENIGRAISFLKFLIVIGYFVSISSAAIRFARYEMIPIILGAGIVFLGDLIIRGKASLTQLFVWIMAGTFFVFCIFVVFSMLRGGGEDGAELSSLIGYGVAPFNHLAYLIDGTLDLRYSGSGMYSFPLLSHIPLIENIFSVREFLSLPPVEDVFISEFLDAAMADLDSRFIWITYFGYVFADFGWFSLGVLFFQGIVLGISWDGFMKGGALGVIFYIYFCQSIVLFGTTNYFGRSALFVVFGAGVVFWLVEQIFLYFSQFSLSSKFDRR